MDDTTGRTRPDVLIVVMDCVRASDFPGGREAVPGMPWVEGLLGESVSFPKAVSVAPWTIPAHASLFTGRYPWDHGCHARASLVLPPEIPRLAQSMSAAGYATFSLSANPFISPTFGLVDGFQKAGWAGWWESFARLPRPTPPQTLADDQVDGRPLLQRVRQGPLGSIMIRAMDDAYRYPFVLDLLNRAAQGVRVPGQSGEVPIAPWIEPTFERWIAEVPPETPTFTFVNLVDAHEPYYADRAVVRSLGDWLDYSRCRQDHLGFAAGDWQLDAEAAAMLHALYRRMIQRMDLRLAALGKTLEKAGRWPNTLMVLTSDHGQAFGEHGLLFHMFRADESVLRIPLIVRPPGGARRTSGTAWTSLIDVAPTVLNAAGAGSTSPTDAYDLASLTDRTRPTPVLAMADGLIWEHVRERFTPARRGIFDRVWGASYGGPRKVLVDLGEGRARAFDPDADPGESRDLWATEARELLPMEAAARDAAERVQHGSRVLPSAEVEERMRSWGY